MPAAKRRIHLNDRTLRSLQAEGGRIDYMDAEMKGFGVRLAPDGTRTFFIRYRTASGWRRYTVGDYARLSLKDAKDVASRLLARVELGQDPQAERSGQRRAETVNDLAEDYLERHARRNKRSWKEDERILRKDILPVLGRLAAQEVRRRDIVKILDRIADRGAPIMANRTRALLSKLFRHGVRREILEHNPALEIDRPAAERSRTRVLTEDELRALWAAWEAEASVTSAAFRLLLLTAQRRVEVLGMRWQDIEGRWWTIPAEVVKNKLAHRVYLSGPTVELLDGLRPLDGSSSPWVCATPRPGARESAPITSLNKATERFRRIAGVEDWSAHDLRRTAATYMARSGVTRFVIGKVLNHAESGVTAVYDRSSYEPEIQRALALWGQRLMGILRLDASDNVIRIG